MCVNDVHIRARECTHDKDGKSFDDLTAAVIFFLGFSVFSDWSVVQEQQNS